jgi:hypothetical protein
VKWTATAVDLVFGSNSRLPALAEVYAGPDPRVRSIFMIGRTRRVLRGPLGFEATAVRARALLFAVVGFLDHELLVLVGEVAGLFTRIAERLEAGVGGRFVFGNTHATDIPGPDMAKHGA